MLQLEHGLYRCDQIKVCEQQAQHLYQLSDDELMARAGQAAFSFITRHFAHARHWAIFCGSGNNAGDGYVLARIAHECGMMVTVYYCKASEDLPAVARRAALSAQAVGVQCLLADEPLDGDTDLIVDALLGIGIQGAVYGLVATAIQQINSSELPVISLDVPSGLNADTGMVSHLGVHATKTLTFMARKTGMYTLDSQDYCGEIYCCPLQLEQYWQTITPYAKLLDESTLSLPLIRKSNSHKGDYGRVLVIGGGEGMPGAVVLAAKAALRTGAGSVTIATSPNHHTALLPVVPEAMIWGIHTAKELEPLLEQATFCIIGPGLGQSDWAHDLFLMAIAAQLPMVIDASALHILAEHPQVDDNWILTPHPGEAGCLLGCSSAIIQEERYQAAAAIQQQYGGVIVLKGAGTIIQTLEKDVFVCTKGNPGMATAGMGDVLSGIIAGLGAQGWSLSEAAKLGVWAHASAGDQVAETYGARGLLASDLINILPHILNSK